MTPLERAARAIFEWDQSVRGGRYEKWEDQFAAFHDHHIARARAVLAAVRTPTDAMIQAGEAETDTYYSKDGDVQRGWQAMIDALLSSAK